MSFEILRAAGYRRMPWKNGGGETREIAVWPPQAALDAFDWRISMATVSADGPFSSFAGVDRTLCVLAGRGLRLDFDGGESVELAPEQAPLHFAADRPVHARLCGGPLTDLNVMTRRGRFRHSVELLALDVARPVEIGVQTALLLCARGRLECSGAAGEGVLEALDSARFEGAAAVRLVPRVVPCAAWLIRLAPA